MKIPKITFCLEQIIVPVIAMLIVYGIINISIDFSFLTSMGDAEDDFSITDVFYKIENSSKQKMLNQKIVLVDVSDIYDRRQLANIIETICSYNPSVVGLDIIFEGEKDDMIANNQLISTLNKHRNIISSNKLLDHNPDTDEFTKSVSSFWNDKVNVTCGYTNLTTNSNTDITRMLSYRRVLNGRNVYSFSNVIAHKALESQPDSIEDRFIDYTSEEFLVIDAIDLPTFKEEIKNKIILVGATKEEQDMHLTPIGKISGLHLQAYSVLTCLNNKAKHHLPYAWQMIIVFCLIWFTHSVIFYIEDFCGNNSTLKYWQDNFTLIFIFAFVVMILYVDYYLYVVQDLLIDIIPCVLGIGLVDPIKKLYAAIINTCTNVFHINILKKSIYYDI